MAIPRFYFPYLLGRQNARKRGVLTKPLALVGLGGEQGKDLLQGTVQNSLPLRITPQKGWAVGVSLLPSGEVLTGYIDQLRTGPQPLHHAARHRQADLIYPGMIHGMKG
jgi:hypothetical protein